VLRESVLRESTVHEVLIVEDDFMVARAHERIVEQNPGFHVTGVAHTGSEALEKIASSHPRLVLLDMYLPDMSGLDVIRRAREARHDVDFLVLTAAREAEIVAGALHGGVVSYLLKPFKIPELESRLSSYAERRRVLSRSAELDQHDLDQALGAGMAVAVGLPKGLSKETAELIARTLQEHAPDLAASECGELLGMSRVIARKYLEHLVRTGDASVALRYGQTGRPQRRYTWVGRSGQG
jgi:Response regulator of citrate/malate metabolism